MIRLNKSRKILIDYTHTHLDMYINSDVYIIYV